MHGVLGYGSKCRTGAEKIGIEYCNTVLHTRHKCDKRNKILHHYFEYNKLAEVAGVDYCAIMLNIRASIEVA